MQRRYLKRRRSKEIVKISGYGHIAVGELIEDPLSFSTFYASKCMEFLCGISFFFSREIFVSHVIFCKQNFYGYGKLPWSKEIQSTRKWKYIFPCRIFILPPGVVDKEFSIQTYTAPCIRAWAFVSKHVPPPPLDVKGKGRGLR